MQAPGIVNEQHRQNRELVWHGCVNSIDICRLCRVHADHVAASDKYVTNHVDHMLRGREPQNTLAWTQQHQEA